MDAVTAFEARGGIITRLPPGAAAYGYSPHQPEGILAPSEYSEFRSARDIITSYFAKQAKTAESPEVREARKERKRSAAKADRERTRQVRLDKIERLYRQGVSLEEIAKDDSSSVDRVRRLLLQRGISVAKDNAAKTAAKIKAPKPKRVDKREIYCAEIIRLYAEEFMPINAIAAKLHICSATVRRVTAKAGVTRKVGGRMFSPAQAARRQQAIEECVRLRKEGASYKKLAAVLGVCHETARRYCTENGV